MGIISKIKSLFVSTISFDETKAKGVVSPYKLKDSKVKVESKVNVPQGFGFVLASSGKCLDVFGAGEFFLTPATLPECCKKLKIHKMDKNNKIKKNFKADVYFVNLNEFTLDLKTSSKAELGGKASGIFRVGMQAKVSLKVIDVKKFMQVLLDEYAYLKQDEAEKIVLAYLSDFVLDILYRYNFALSEFLSCNKIIDENLTTELGHKVAKMGLVLQGLDEIKFIMQKKYQKEYEQSYQKLHNPNYVKPKEEAKEEEAKDTNEQLKEEPKSKQNNDKEIETQEVKQIENVLDDGYRPFGSIIIEKVTKPNIVETKNNATEIEKQTEEDNKAQEQEFVDLNLDNLYKSDKKGKKCKFCGLVNSSEATVCEICNNNLD